LPAEIATRDPLAIVWRNFDRALDAFTARQLLAA